MKKSNKTLLNELHIKVQQLKFPSFPLHCLPPYKHSDNSTNGLTNCVIDFLNYSGHQAERINTTGRMLNKKKKFTDVVGFSREIGSMQYIPGTGTKGSADISSTISVLIDGKKYGLSVKWEIKFKKDIQSDYQKKYENKIKESGGYYFIVRNFDEFIEIYNEFMQHDR